MTGRLTIWLWAARDVLRHPWQALLTGVALSSVIIFATVPLLLSTGMTSLAEDILEKGPSLVARRISGGQWGPIPVAEAVEAALSVPGVVSARPRIWGVAAGPDGPVTVVGIADGTDRNAESFSDFASPPKRGEAVVGPGVLATNREDGAPLPSLTLMAEKRLTVAVAGCFDEKSALVAHDIVVLHADDAREILGLSPGYASDLAIRVFHEQEADAVMPDLADAFAWPSRMTTRTEALKSYTASTARRGGLFYLVLAPCILAMALIVVAAYGNAARGSANAGLLKALGWTAPDIVRLFLCKALLVTVPAVAAGMACSYFLIYWPGTVWPGYLFFGWKQTPPGLHLAPSDAIPILALAAAAAATPYLAANLWPALRCAAADPHDLLRSKGAW